MQKIKKLQIHNFQSHADSVLDFSDGLNIILGESQAGKTSIFRSLVKLVRDEPLGGDFVSHWGNKCSVTIEGNDGTKVTREIQIRRDNTGRAKVDKHSYIVEQPNGGRELYTGFNRTIPDEVKNAIGFPLITVGDNDIDLHFAGQHDAYFLVLKSHASLRVKLFSYLSHNDVIEQARSLLRTSIRSLKSLVKDDEQQLQELESSIDELRTFKKSQPLLKDAGKHLSEVQKLYELLEHYMSYLSSVTIINVYKVG